LRKVLLDASPMVALFDGDDDHHRHYAALIGNPDHDFLLNTTWPCVAEASHLLEPVASRALLRWLGRGAAHVYAFEATHLVAMAQIMDTYSEPRRTRMDFADASLWWVARQTQVRTVLTTDQRDFYRYRLPDGSAFEIL
jgi:uncharacterized protein